MLRYDRVNSTLGSFSYKDNSIVNPNVYLLVCGVNNSYINDTVRLLYSSESGNITVDLLTINPVIYSIENIFLDNTTNLTCAKLDIDISAFKAIYPAIPFVGLYEWKEYNKTINVTTQINNTTVVNVTNITTKILEPIVVKKINQTLNGSYVLGVDIDDIEKKTFLTVIKIFDNNQSEITNVTKDYLIISIVKNNQSVAEALTAPKRTTPFNYMFSRDEVVYVNGIPSLKVKVVPPCSKINETGYYYIINDSAWNANDSCLVVENVSSIVIDFANKTIDGDGNINGSLSQNKCGIIAKNVENVTLKDVRVQDYYHGVCVINSKNVKIFGTSDQANIKGIYVKNATTKIFGVKLNNTDSEIYAEDNGIVELQQTYFSTANLSTTAKDVIIKNVFDPPKDPKGLVNISQWINISKNGDSWLKRITFHFTFPNPQGVLPKVIYKFDGIYVNGTWENETWEALNPTYVDIANKYIFADINLTNFSIFAPYGEEINITKPKPVPEPTPTPQPSETTGKEEKAIPPRLNLTLHVKEVKVQQGQTAEIGFNLTNVGKIDVENAMVIADVRRGWETSPVNYPLIKVGETKVGKFYFTVYDNEVPGTYYVPVRAVLAKNNVTVDVELLKVIVIPRQRIARLEILELAPFLSLEENSKIPIAILVKNTGDYNLTNIKLSVEYAGNCIESVSGSYNLNVGKEGSLVYTLKTKKAPAECKSIFVLKSDQGAVAFAPVVIKITPKPIHKILVLPIITVILTIVTMYILVKKKILPRLIR